MDVSHVPAITETTAVSDASLASTDTALVHEANPTPAQPALSTEQVLRLQEHAFVLQMQAQGIHPTRKQVRAWEKVSKKLHKHTGVSMPSLVLRALAKIEKTDQSLEGVGVSPRHAVQVSGLSSICTVHLMRMGALMVSKTLEQPGANAQASEQPEPPLEIKAKDIFQEQEEGHKPILLKVHPAIAKQLKGYLAIVDVPNQEPGAYAIPTAALT